MEIKTGRPPCEMVLTMNGNRTFVVRCRCMNVLSPRTSWQGRGYGYDALARLVSPTTQEVKAVWQAHVEELAHDDRVRARRLMEDIGLIFERLNPPEPYKTTLTCTTSKSKAVSLASSA